MKKIKEMSKAIETNFKHLLKKLPITLITIFVATIYFICILKVDTNNNIISGISTFLSIFAIISLFIETYTYNKRSLIKLVIMYFINLLITLSFTFIFNNSLDYMFGVKKEIFLVNSFMVLVGILGTFGLLSIYKMYKLSNLKFHEYLLTVFAGFFKILVFDIALNIGIAIIFFLFRALIFEDLDEYILIRMLILLQGGFFIPAILKVFFSENEKEEGKFFKVLFAYIILPIYLLINLILYIYIVKILLNNDLPVGFIYPVVTAIFISGFFISNFIKNYSDKKLLNTISKIIPYLIIPLIVLQIHSSYIRYENYGITPARYVTYVFIIFEIISVILMILRKKEKQEYIILTLTILLLFTTCTPFNLLKVSTLNQKARLDSVKDMKVEDMSEEQQDKFEGSYYYLKSVVDSEKYITDELKDKMEAIEENQKIEGYTPTRSINYYSSDNKIINIKEYSYFRDFSYRYNANSNNNYTYNSYESQENKNYESKILDITSDIIKLNKSLNFDFDEYIEEKGNIIELDTNSYVYVKSFYIYVEKDTNNISSIYISGYLLQK